MLNFHLVTLAGCFNDLLEKNVFCVRSRWRHVSCNFPVLSPDEDCGKLEAARSGTPMRTTILVILFAPFVLSETAGAEVTEAEAIGFTSVNEVTVDAQRMAAWRAAVDEIDRWWSADHTVSGEASRLRIDARPQGCFCERLGPDAGVVHMTVTTIIPGALLRLTGGLGPLGLMGVNGNMTWEFAAAENNTVVRFTYAVGGYRPGGLDALAEVVDAVIAEALQRLKAYIETGDAERLGLE